MMKKTNFLFSALIAAALVFSFSSCTEDDIDPLAPEISLQSGAELISADAFVDANSIVKVSVRAVKGTAPLKLLRIFEDNLSLNLERIVDGVNANPAAILSEADKSSFTYVISLKVHEEGTKEYKFEIEDENGLKANVVIALSVVPKTAFNINVPELIVYNADGPTGFYGAVDLQEGVAIASADDEGDVQDLGLVSGTSDWQKKIRGKNGTTMSLPVSGLEFDQIEDLEALMEAYGNGTEVQEADVTLNSVFLFKSPSQVTDKFDYFIMKTLEITETTDDNKDFYVFHLKGYAHKG